MIYSNFAAMPISPELLKATEKMGFITPSPIQAEAISAILEGRDIIGQAQTGTGKTAAFGIPLLQMTAAENKSVQALILCPTRELAIQVAAELGRLGEFMPGLKILAIYGGQPIERQIQALARGVQVVVGTPGRVKDHLGRGTLNLNKLSFLVLDEADEMLNMGFREEIEDIIKEIPNEVQRAFFSATMPEQILRLCSEYLKNPMDIKITRPTLTVAAIDQSFYEIRPYRKLDALARLLEWEKYNKALVFCSTRKMVDDLALFVQNKGIGADALHGELAQSQRDRVMSRFRTGELKVLAATDVAARGLDVDDVDLVINFDLPFDHESYVHRVGRTGRAGRSGKALTIISSREHHKLLNIMRFTKAEINRAKLPSFSELLDVKVNAQLEKLAAELSQGQDLEIFEKHIDKLDGSDYKRISAVLLRMLLKQQMGDLDCCKGDDADDLHEIPFQKARRHGQFEGGQWARASSDKRGKQYAQGGHGERHTQFGAPGKGRRYPADKNMVALLFNIGKKAGITPGDLVGTITNLSGVAGKEIGHINLSQEYALVDIDRDQADNVLRQMNKTRIRGKKIRVDFA